ncbi:CAMK/CAMKL protein kinase, variant [Aphanomyces astaci]|uniref:CAMK/CAMKL protein kinase, variant n=1 Tax=Aphanomyces astaci TaxID=112090 RepID=W4FUR3_APHAT|nr:CAMK/CAMKL protein kinase, variant [Aphanomyces astaci]ETV70398.1 CAMK/CAMKL protein kinase, variant [Aphanomyces astaci]|eukprot:XP_009840110.1 CAMK/CAMKL protein kinase, variant [Aphanomyces astaci]
MSCDGDDGAAIPTDAPSEHVLSMEMLLLLAPDAHTMDMVLAAVLESKAYLVDVLARNSSLTSVKECLDKPQHVAASRRRMAPGDIATWFLPKPSHGIEGSESTLPEWKPDVDKYKKKVAKMEKRIKAFQAEVERLQHELHASNDRCATLHMEFEQFNLDVHELQAQYVKVLEANQRILWEYLPQHDSSLSLIPPLAHDVMESVTIVGDYTIHGTLGEGQYAAVYACSRNAVASSASTTSTTSTGLQLPHATPSSSSPTVDNVVVTLALKAINKSKLNDITALVRVHSEISALSDPALRHPSLLSVKHVIHTSKFIYLVTERGGKDLFDFFGPHDKGVSEATALRIAFKIVEAVKHMHMHGYCHRDLKPENILFTHDNYMVKIVDFGLCAKVGTTPLTDFCGSPGFFAPEMLLHDQYDGQKADVWSIGCILLEVGHERTSSY